MLSEMVSVQVNIIQSGLLLTKGAGNYAAQVCANYQSGGYGDWYLPSKYELNLLYQQKAVVGGFADCNYWSSSEVRCSSSAWNQYFANGNQTCQP